MSLSGKTLANTYKDLLQVDNSNNGVDGTARKVKDGEGTTSALSISDDFVGVQPENDDTTAMFQVISKGGTNLLTVDSTNSLVTALGNKLNTQYANFMIGNTEGSAFADDTHQAIPFESASFGTKNYPPAFGTGTDPATTFTTSDGNGTRASDIVPCIWMVQDAISIDAVWSLEGADNATGDTTIFNGHNIRCDILPNKWNFISTQ